MSRFDECVDKYVAESKKRRLGLDPAYLRAVAKSLGPSIYKADAEKVSSSDPKELARVKKNFLIKKLGLKDTPRLDEGMAKVMKKLGSSNRNKYRAIVYAMLAAEFRKKSVYK